MKEQHPLQTGRLIKWSLRFLVLSLVLCALLGASMLRWLPRGLLFGVSAVRLYPFVFILVWGIGSIVAYFKSRSIEFAATLAGIGVALFFVLPVCLWIGMLLIHGFPNVK